METTVMPFRVEQFRHAHQLFDTSPGTAVFRSAAIASYLSVSVLNTQSSICVFAALDWRMELETADQRWICLACALVSCSRTAMRHAQDPTCSCALGVLFEHNITMLPATILLDDFGWTCNLMFCKPCKPFIPRLTPHQSKWFSAEPATEHSAKQSNFSGVFRGVGVVLTFYDKRNSQKRSQSPGKPLHHSLFRPYYFIHSLSQDPLGSRDKRVFTARSRSCLTFNSCESTTGRCLFAAGRQQALKVYPPFVTDFRHIWPVTIALAETVQNPGLS